MYVSSLRPSNGWNRKLLLVPLAVKLIGWYLLRPSLRVKLANLPSAAPRRPAFLAWQRSLTPLLEERSWCTKQPGMLADSSEIVFEFPSNPSTTRNFDAFLVLEFLDVTATTSLLPGPWCCTTFPGRSNGSSMMILPMMLFREGNRDAFWFPKTSLNVAWAAAFVPSCGDASMVSMRFLS